MEEETKFIYNKKLYKVILEPLAKTNDLQKFSITIKLKEKLVISPRDITLGK